MNNSHVVLPEYAAWSSLRQRNQLHSQPRVRHHVTSRQNQGTTAPPSFLLCAFLAFVCVSTVLPPEVRRDNFSPCASLSAFDFCALSSVVEHYLHTVGVVGSKPTARTIFPFPPPRVPHTSQDRNHRVFTVRKKPERTSPDNVMSVEGERRIEFAASVQFRKSAVLCTLKRWPESPLMR